MATPHVSTSERCRKRYFACDFHLVGRLIRGRYWIRQAQTIQNSDWLRKHLIGGAALTKIRRPEQIGRS